jgi:hypothetical protein
MDAVCEREICTPFGYQSVAQAFLPVRTLLAIVLTPFRSPVSRFRS